MSGEGGSIYEAFEPAEKKTKELKPGKKARKIAKNE